MIMMRAGIYRLIARCPNRSIRFYVGQARDVEGRGRSHFRALRRNKHNNPKLQHAFNKYGEHCFSFEVVLICKAEKNILTFYEQLVLDSYPAKLVFNIHRKCVISPLGLKRTLEQKAVLSAAKKGKPGHKQTEETCLQIGATKKKKGQKPSAEAIAKSIALRIGKPLPESQRKAISIGNTGKIMSTESRAASREGALRRYEREEERRKSSKRMLGNKNGLGSRRSRKSKKKQKIAALKREAFWRENPELRPKLQLEALLTIGKASSDYWERWRNDPAVRASRKPWGRMKGVCKVDGR